MDRRPLMAGGRRITRRVRAAPDADRGTLVVEPNTGAPAMDGAPGGDRLPWSVSVDDLEDCGASVDSSST